MSHEPRPTRESHEKLGWTLPSSGGADRWQCGRVVAISRLTCRHLRELVFDFAAHAQGPPSGRGAQLFCYLPARSMRKALFWRKSKYKPTRVFCYPGSTLTRPYRAVDPHLSCFVPVLPPSFNPPHHSPVPVPLCFPPSVPPSCPTRAEKKVLKRSPVQPKGAYVVNMGDQEVETIQALPFVDLV